MYKVVTILALLSRLPREIMTLRACSPNTKFTLNGKLCFCNNQGYWNEANCKLISRRHSCQPGQIIWQGCNQCICQKNGHLLCSNSHCSDENTRMPSLQDLSSYGRRCIPFRSYYINCSICICPATGLAKDAQCVADISCNNTQTYPIDAAVTRKTNCIPNVMYITRCRQCLCSDSGHFDPEYCENKCGETASSAGLFKSSRCIPRTLYRSACSVCRCPSNGRPDYSLCVKTDKDQCNRKFKYPLLHTLRSGSTRCTPHSFTAARCLYCHCNAKETIDENVCLEIGCAETRELNRYFSAKTKCIPGEMVPICMECFCLRDGQTMPKYCSRICSHQSKLNIIEMVLKDTGSNANIIERDNIKRADRDGRCLPNTLYISNGKYCLCPEKGEAISKYCTSIVYVPSTKTKKDIFRNNQEIDFKIPCEPNTFVEFDCNTCYCFKDGKIDPKWCTYDDCEAKRVVIESHKNPNPIDDLTFIDTTCRPGVITNFKCNFCICPESGILKEQACTKNNCTEFDHSMYLDKVTCEPLAYYEVDCNICYCPRDGIKNVAKCTKNQCEKSFLRSDSCIPGQLFSDDCNLCVCPPDGDKRGKACTTHICPHIPPWQVFRLSDSILNKQITLDETRTLDICFPGEEFVKGCNLCVCPELGLKMYAICEPVLCDDHLSTNDPNSSTKQHNETQKLDRYYIESRRAADDDCFTYNISHSAERKECTPGTMYIIRCKQCICPYLGNINNFCRPLPKNMFCEQAFPNFNYLPMGRRRFEADFSNNNENVTNDVDISSKSKKNIQIKVQHAHTNLCEKPGKILDKCFICDCEDNTVIEEHCFKSDADDCKDAKPTFLVENKVDL